MSVWMARTILSSYILYISSVFLRRLWAFLSVWSCQPDRASMLSYHVRSCHAFLLVCLSCVCVCVCVRVRVCVCVCVSSPLSLPLCHPDCVSFSHPLSHSNNLSLSPSFSSLSLSLSFSLSLLIFSS